MRDQDADCVAKPCCTSRCCNSMGSRAFCDTRTGGDAHWVCKGLHPRDERTKPGEAPQDAPHDVLGRRDAVGGTPSLCQEPSETDAGTSTLVGNAPLSVQNRTNLPDTLRSRRFYRWKESRQKIEIQTDSCPIGSCPSHRDMGNEGKQPQCPSFSTPKNSSPSSMCLDGRLSFVLPIKGAACRSGSFAKSWTSWASQQTANISKNTVPQPAPRRRVSGRTWTFASLDFLTAR